MITEMKRTSQSEINKYFHFFGSISSLNLEEEDKVEMDRSLRLQLSQALMRIETAIHNSSLKSRLEFERLFVENNPLILGVFTELQGRLFQIRFTINTEDSSTNNLEVAKAALSAICKNSKSINEYFS